MALCLAGFGTKVHFLNMSQHLNNCCFCSTGSEVWHAATDATCLRMDACSATSSVKEFFPFFVALLLIDKRKQQHWTSGLRMVAVNSKLRGEIWKKVRKMGRRSKTCDCQREKTKTKIMLHIQEIFSCWNKLGAHKRRRVRSVHTLRHLPA